MIPNAEDRAHELIRQMAPRIENLVDAAVTTWESVREALWREEEAVRQNFDAVDAVAAGIKVNIVPLKEMARKLLEDSAWMRRVFPIAFSDVGIALLNVLLQTEETPSLIAGQPPTRFPVFADNLTFAQAQLLRSDILGLGRKPEVADIQTVQEWVGKLTKALGDEMATVAKTGNKPALKEAYAHADKHWKDLDGAFNRPGSTLFRALRTMGSVEVLDLFIQPKSISVGTLNADLLEKYGIDKSGLKFATLTDLYEKNFVMESRLGGYPDEFLKSLFEPDELGSLYKVSEAFRGH